LLRLQSCRHVKVQLAHGSVNQILLNEVNELTRLKGSRRPTSVEKPLFEFAPLK